MKKRPIVGLMVGGLMAAMLPGAATADWPGERGDKSPEFEAVASCTAKSGGFAFIISPPGPAGTQGQVRAEAAKVCVPGTVQFTKSKASPAG